MKFFKLKPAGDGLTDSLKWFKKFGITGPLDMQFGPDGAIYVLNYGPAYFGTTEETKIARIEYTGSCRPTVAVNSGGTAAPTASRLTGTRLQVNMRGSYALIVRTVQGRVLARFSGDRPRSYSIRELAPAGTRAVRAGLSR